MIGIIVIFSFFEEGYAYLQYAPLLPACVISSPYVEKIIPLLPLHDINLHVSFPANPYCKKNGHISANTLQPHLLSETIQISPDNHILILNSAADPYVPIAAQQLTTGTITLAEDNIASLHKIEKILSSNKLRHVAFHEYALKEPPETIDIAIMNLLYQPAKAWMIYAIQIAAYTLKPGARLYVIGAKDRGILSIAKQMEEIFGNVETLLISKGYRVISSRKKEDASGHPTGKNNMEQFTRYSSIISEPDEDPSDGGEAEGSSKSQKNSEQFTRYLSQISESGGNAPAASALLAALHGPSVFAQGKLDEGTRLLIEALEVQPTDNALDIGC